MSEEDEQTASLEQFPIVEEGTNDKRKKRLKINCIARRLTREKTVNMTEINDKNSKKH